MLANSVKASSLIVWIGVSKNNLPDIIYSIYIRCLMIDIDDNDNNDDEDDNNDDDMTMMMAL